MSDSKDIPSTGRGRLGPWLVVLASLLVAVAAVSSAFSASTPIATSNPPKTLSETAPTIGNPPPTAVAATPTPVAVQEPGPPKLDTVPVRLETTPVPLPGGKGGIGLDDLLFARGLKKVVVPGGRSGNLDLIDPETRVIVPVSGFSEKNESGVEKGHAGQKEHGIKAGRDNQKERADQKDRGGNPGADGRRERGDERESAGGRGEGINSVDEVRDLLFVTDRTELRLDVVDPATRTIVAQTRLAGGPDYVRFVKPTGEVWVTQPGEERIEIFTLPAKGKQIPSHDGFINVPGGPESLVIDESHHRAYTHTWKGSTAAIDLGRREIVATWSNGCEGSRGIALDPVHGFLFVGCAEGRAVALDPARDGAIVGKLDHGSGVDIIAFNPVLRHLYLPGGKSKTMAILGVAESGGLSLLGTVKTAEGSHCVVADDRSQAWVCDPGHGRLLLVHDTLPAVK